MSTFIVERIYKGFPLFETINGVEDIDLSMYNDIQTLWVCETKEEILAVENELRRKHARRSEQA